MTFVQQLSVTDQTIADKIKNTVEHIFHVHNLFNEWLLDGFGTLLFWFGELHGQQVLLGLKFALDFAFLDRYTGAETSDKMFESDFGLRVLTAETTHFNKSNN